MYFSYRYDFNSDNYITEEDVRIVLSYVPFKNGSPTVDGGFASMSHAMALISLGSNEGLYNSDQGRNLEYKDRVAEQQEIRAFTSKVFANKKEMSF